MRTGIDTMGTASLILGMLLMVNRLWRLLFGPIRARTVSAACLLTGAILVAVGATGFFGFYG